jgi:hypothetical protein
MPSACSTSNPQTFLIKIKKEKKKNRKIKMIHVYKNLHTEYINTINISFANFAYINEHITWWCINS